MKILLIADVHNKPFGSIRTRHQIKGVIRDLGPDLIVFLGDTVHGPNVKRNYEKYLRQILDLTNGVAFATVFGNHDDECYFSKDEYLDIVKSYPNSVTNGRDYVLNINGESLVFIDSGSYYQGEGSYYDIVKDEQIDFVIDKLKDSGSKAILFQHIIVPDIMELIEETDKNAKHSYKDGGKYYRFKDGVEYIGEIKENPCPPNLSTPELERLAPYVKAMCFGHDHLNTFELDLKGVRIIQCGGSSYNSYDKKSRSNVKLLDTETLKTDLIYL